ncbi:hypothetical protein DFJ73DRAFT_775641 [Zopfochytrium polystomum]|nr:hypothetical protein DFJ73DRAFT_775641 [Zopfochytrium polystomum]
MLAFVSRAGPSPAVGRRALKRLRTKKKKKKKKKKLTWNPSFHHGPLRLNSAIFRRKAKKKKKKKKKKKERKNLQMTYPDDPAHSHRAHQDASLVSPSTPTAFAEANGAVPAASSSSLAAFAIAIATGSPSSPIEVALAALSGYITVSTGDLLPFPVTLFLLRFLLALASRFVASVAVTELQMRVFAWLYRRGVLSRYQEDLPTGRNLADFVVGQSAVVAALTAYAVARQDDLAGRTVFDVDVVQVLVWQMVLFAVMDVWYYFGHRLMHKNKFLWNNVHHKHHLQKNINVYTTSYATATENLLLIVPPLLLFTYLFERAHPDVYNATTFAACVASQFLVLSVGHSGFKHHPILFAVPFPPALTHLLPHAVGLGLRTQDHEMHHVYPLCNYALNFSLWDYVLGSHRDIEELQAFKKTKSEATKAGTPEAARRSSKKKEE